jgi:hypothetical protein
MGALSTGKGGGLAASIDDETGGGFWMRPILPHRVNSPDTSIVPMSAGDAGLGEQGTSSFDHLTGQHLIKATPVKVPAITLPSGQEISGQSGRSAPFSGCAIRFKMSVRFESPPHTQVFQQWPEARRYRLTHPSLAVVGPFYYCHAQSRVLE